MREPRGEGEASAAKAADAKEAETEEKEEKEEKEGKEEKEEKDNFSSILDAGSSSRLRMKPATELQGVGIQEKGAGKEEEEVGPFKVSFRLVPAQRTALNSMAAYYSDEQKMEDVLHRYATASSPVSLRALDWLVTNVAKKRTIVCVSREGRTFNIFHGYRLALRTFRRRMFDPFRRRLRIQYKRKGEWFDTTIGQAFFLSWADKNGVLGFAERNVGMIEEDMNRAAVEARAGRKERREEGGKRRKRELSRQEDAKFLLYPVQSVVKM